MDQQQPDFYDKFQQEVRAASKAKSADGKIHFTEAKKIIIDCDPGGDDAQAIILALHLCKKHDIEVIGITTVAGNATLDHVLLNT